MEIDGSFGDCFDITIVVSIADDIYASTIYLDSLFNLL